MGPVCVLFDNLRLKTLFKRNLMQQGGSGSFSLTNNIFYTVHEKLSESGEISTELVRFTGK